MELDSCVNDCSVLISSAPLLIQVYLCPNSSGYSLFVRMQFLHIFFLNTSRLTTVSILPTISQYVHLFGLFLDILRLFSSSLRSLSSTSSCFISNCNVLIFPIALIYSFKLISIGKGIAHSSSSSLELFYLTMKT